MRVRNTGLLLVGAVVGFLLASASGQGPASNAQSNTLPPIFKKGGQVECTAVVAGMADPVKMTVAEVSGGWVSAQGRAAVSERGGPEGAWLHATTGVLCWPGGQTP